MDAIERVLKALEHEEPDKVPTYEALIDNPLIYEHFGEEYAYNGMNKSINDAYNVVNGDTEELTKLLLQATATRGYLKNMMNNWCGLFEKLGVDLFMVPLTGHIFFPQHVEKDYFTDEYGRNFDFKYNHQYDIELIYYRDGAYKSFEDYMAAPQPDPDNPRRKKYFMAMKKAEKAKQGKVYAMPGVWGLFEATWQGFGFSDFSKLLIHSEKIKKIFDDRGKFAVECVKRFIEWGEENLLFILDDYGYKSGLLMSPRNYKKYVIPWIKEICKVAHKAGLKVILHSCGDIYMIFEDLINAGVDAFNPIEATTANPDYDIFKLGEKYGDKISLIGNVSPQDLSTESPEFIHNYTKKLIKEVAPGGGYILSTGHSINPAVKLENYLAMQDAHKKYGKYPIK